MVSCDVKCTSFVISELKTTGTVLFKFCTAWSHECQPFRSVCQFLMEVMLADEYNKHLYVKLKLITWVNCLHLTSKKWSRCAILHCTVYVLIRLGLCDESVLRKLFFSFGLTWSLPVLYLTITGIDRKTKSLTVKYSNNLREELLFCSAFWGLDEWVRGLCNARSFWQWKYFFIWFCSFFLQEGADVLS